MTIIIGIIFEILGLAMIINPRKVWLGLEGYMYKSTSELTNVYVIYTRVSGLVITVIGIYLIFLRK